MTSSNYLQLGCKTTIIPNTVSKISSFAFEGCIGLTSIAIPDSVTGINASAFVGCTGLTKIFIPNSVTDILSQTFLNCSPTLVIYCGATSKPSGWSSGWNYYDTSNALTTYWGYTREQFEAL